MLTFTYYSKAQVYDAICKLLTDYESMDDTQEEVTEDDLYNALTDIIDNWDSITGDDDKFIANLGF